MVKVEIGAIQQPKKGNNVTGDSYGVFENDGRLIVILSDGLGSGSKAQKASLTSVELTNENLQQDPENLIRILNEGLRNTRGAAVAIAEIDLTSLTLKFVSIGNVQGLIWGMKKTMLISIPGIIGYNLKEPIMKQVYQLDSKDTLVLYSDGLRITDLSCYNNLDQYNSAQEMAESILNVSEINNDDLTLLVLKFNQKE